MWLIFNLGFVDIQLLQSTNDYRSKYVSLGCTKKMSNIQKYVCNVNDSKKERNSILFNSVLPENEIWKRSYM